MGHLSVTHSLAASIALAVGVLPTSTFADDPDFARDVAPVLARCCVECHGARGPGAYPLETPAQVKRVARTVRAVLGARSMPPWLPVEGVASAPPRPSDAEIARIAAWIDAGAPIDARTADKPFAPPRAAGTERATMERWRVAEGWSIGAAESRVMRSFQFVPALEEDLLVGGWRVVPDARGLVSLGLVSSGDAALARELDERDASIGFKFTGDLGTRPAAALAGFGIDGRFELPRGFAMRVKKGDAITVEMHADGRGRVESGACIVEALAPTAGDAAGAPRVVEPFVVSAQGAARERTDGATISYSMPPLEQALDLAAITVRPGPYGVKVLLTAHDPASKAAPRALLRIDRYDIHLDRPYAVEPPVRLARGTVLALEVTAENETLATRSTPQAVLLVAPVDDAVAAAAPAHETAASPAAPTNGPLARAFATAATTIPTGAGQPALVSTELVPAPVFREAMGYDPEPRTGATDAAGMSWFEAVELANKLSVSQGMQPAYRIEFAQRDGKRLVGCVVSPTDGDGWRLPDERAWETTFDARPAIRGEIWNWTSTQDGAARVVRGGCWADNAGTQGKSARSSLPPATRSELFGARFVRPFSRCATRP